MIKLKLMSLADAFALVYPLINCTNKYKWHSCPPRTIRLIGPTVLAVQFTADGEQLLHETVFNVIPNRGDAFVCGGNVMFYVYEEKDFSVLDPYIVVDNDDDLSECDEIQPGLPTWMYV